MRKLWTGEDGPLTAVESVYWEAFYYLEPWETHVLDADEYGKRNTDADLEGRILMAEMRAMFEKAKAAKADG